MYKVSNNNKQTNSTTYVNMLDGAVPFTTGQKGCVIVTFTTQMNSGTYRAMVRARLDNMTDGMPGEYRLAEAVNEVETRTATFVFANVPAGAHTLRMQFASPDAENIFFNGHLILVQYRK